jgi:hypothetical protein
MVLETAEITTADDREQKMISNEVDDATVEDSTEDSAEDLDNSSELLSAGLEFSEEVVVVGGTEVAVKLLLVAAIEKMLLETIKLGEDNDAVVDDSVEESSRAWARLLVAKELGEDVLAV